MSSLKNLLSPFAGNFKPITAFFLVFIMLAGFVPAGVSVGVYAQEPASASEDEGFMYLDGERIPLEDERITNVVPVLSPVGAFDLSGPRTGGALPSVSRIFAVSGQFAREPVVYMGSRRVSAQRYAVDIDGIYYEAFCADPALPGPENAGAVYEIVGPAAERYRTVLRYGFPTNPYFSQEGPDAPEIEDRMWWAYVTRVAVAMVNNPNREFTGDENAISQARALVDGSSFWVRNFDETMPAIMVNGVRWAEDLYNVVEATDTTAQSDTFTVTHNRRNHNAQNRFRFEWAAGTPDGAELIVNGNVLATAPQNSMDVFYGDVSFQIRMPNEDAFRGQEAKVYLVGIHNHYAGRVWLMQNPNDRENWQDIVFYIPYMRASAIFSFEQAEEEGNLRIIKRNPAGRGLAGAVFEITGPDGFHVTRTTPSNGVIFLSGLEPGEYIVTEITPPPGHYLAEQNSQTVTVVAGSTETIEVVFVNQPRTGNGNGYYPRVAPPASVRIQKIDALSRENIPDALMRIEGRSNFTMTTADGQIWQINNRGIDMSIVLTEGHTLPVVPEQEYDDDGNPVGPPPVHFELEDGVLTIHNLPWGYFRVQEERAPDGYSLLPQHTAYSFWLLPPNVLVSVAEGGSGNGDADGEEGGIEAMIAAILNDNLGGPAYELPDDFPPSETDGGGVEFIIDEEANVNSILITFENYPFSEIVVYKHCNVTNAPLAGAHIRIQGFFVEGNAPVITDRTYVTDSAGRVVFYGLPAGTYTISEIQPPPGFMLDSPNFHSVDVSWGQTRANANRPAPVVRFYNTPLSSLEIIKIDGDTGARLDGAVFELRDPATGETWQGTTAGGSVRLGQGSNSNELIPGRTYILTEIQAPPGYVLIPTPQEVVLSPGVNNQVTIRNYQNPTLTIVKRDIDTQEPLAGAVFEVVFENGQTVQGSPFTTGSDGTVTIPWTLFEGNSERTLIITEIVAPPGYHLASPNWQRVTMRAGEHNVVTFENARKPTITIQKRDAITGMPIANAEFTIEKITDPGRGMLTGNPFRTDANGQIVLPFQYAGRYRIVETRPAPNYWLDPLEQNRSWIIEVRENEDYLLIVENTLLPSLIITKWNALTMRPVPLTHFRVEFEVPNSGNVIHIGNFVTNQNGQIILPFVQSGWYRITETRPAPGMALNVNNNYRVFLAPGQNTYTLMQQGLIPSVFEGIAPYPASSVEPPDIPEETEQLPPTDNPSDDTFIIESDNPGEYVVNIYDIEIVDDPALVARVTSGLSVTGGDSWNTGYGVWNWPLNSIVIKKTDITNGRMLAGATFDLIHVSTGESGTRGTVIGTFTTNHSGIIVITGLEPGAYVVEEVIPPENFMLAVNNRQHAFLRPDGFSIVETHFSNYPYGSLLITLRCEVTGVPIQNGEFRVNTSDGTVVGTANGLFRTNQEGYILIPNLRPGSYVVTQLLPAPDGFVLGSVVVPQTIHVRPDGQTYRLEFTNQPLSTLIIRKIDSYDNSPIAGARYRVYRQDNSFVGEFLTDNQGLIEIPRLLGWFTVREVDVPHGFEFDMQTVRTVQVQSHAPALVTFYSPRLGSLTIEAVDQHGTPLAGATFRVNRQSGELVGTYTTGASGVINIPNLTSGWYFVEATSAPSGFIIGEEGRSVEVLANTAPVTRFVFPRLSVLTIEKVDDMGRPLAGATFEVRRPNGERISMGTTNNAGVFVVNGIAPGTVIIEETQAPAGFAIVEQARTVEFTPGQNRTERFRNYRLGTLVIENVDENHAPLQGGRFRVSRPNGEIIGDFLAPISGIITIPMLTSGAYIVEQIAPPPGFVLSDTGRTVEVLANQTVRTTFINTRQPSLTIEKVDEDGNPLANAEFEVRRPNGELVTRAVTNNGGVIHVPNLAPGTYIVEETRAPAGFVITEAARTIEIVAGQVRVERFVNYRAPALVIEKVCEDGNPLAGAEFEVRRLNGELVIRGVTNQGGLFIVPNLEPGAYEVIETRAPAGFVVTEPSRAIEIVAGQTRTERFVNYRAATLTIEKVDADGNPLAGAEFEVRRPNGELIARLTTNNGGVATINNIEAGTVIIEETRAPQGFVITEPARTVIITAGQNVVERFVNHRQPSLIIEKVDTDGNPLANAEFEVRTLGGQLVHRAVTNQGGLITIPYLTPGSFQVIETRAPEGFVVTEPSRAIEIVAGQTRTERFVNTRAATLTIEKVDMDGNPLAGAEFEVRRPNGELIARLTTNNGGVATINNIEAGTVIIEETRAPQGFVITEPARTVTITAGQNVVERFVNYRQPSLVIEKVDTDGNPLANAEFEVRTLGGQLVHRAVTNQGGLITIPYLTPGSFQVIETRAPEGFVITEPARAIEIFSGQTVTERFINHRMPALIIEKVDTDGNPLDGATFEVRTLAGLLVERVVTNQGGMAIIHELAPGSYEIIETIAPQGFALVEGSRAIQIVAGQTVTERFVNPRLATLVIQKVDGVSNAPLQGVVFEVSTLAGDRLPNHINNSFEFVTDTAGMIRLPNLPAGTWVITETRPLPGYMAAEPVVLAVGVDSEYVITVRNYRYPDYNILKLDGVTGLPLAGVEFEIAHFFANGQIGSRLRNPIDGSFTWVTDAAGLIRIPNLEHGTYVAIETRPLPGYRLAEPRIFVVADHEPTTITIHNYRYSEWNIRKLDGHTDHPQAGVVFEVAVFHGSGTTGDRLRNAHDGSFEFVTDSAGIARIGALPPGTFIITETRPLSGFIAAEPVIITVTGAEIDTTVTIRNYRMPDFVIRKTDGDTGQPLAGVHFEIARYFGSGNAGERLQNPVDGSFTFITDNAGLIRLPHMEAGTFVAIETRALPGFVLADPVTFVVGPNATNTTIDIRNYREANLTIQKINSITRGPLAGVVFEISRPDGTRLVNPRTGNHDFITDERGLIHLPVIEDGRFYLRETRALPGFLIDEEIIGFNIDSSARQREHLLVVENTPAAGLLIIARDAQTRRPLQGIEVEVRHADGRVVTGQLLDGNQPSTPANSPQLSASGNFVTDRFGRINLNHLAPGVYHVRVVNSLGGYQWDTDVHVVTVIAGQQTVLELESIPLGGFRLLHVDAITGAPIFNAEFMIFDHNNKVVGNWQTDNRGIIDFSAVLTAGRYTIRLTRPAPGYSRDDVPRTVEFIAGRVTEIVWEAIPIGGQLQILKVSGDANQHNGLPAGTPLAGAIFEIFEARTGNLVDRIVSNERGMAVSRPLPMGRYIAREVAAPAFYMINPQEIHFEIEHENQIVRVTFPNFSANVGVTIRKTGPQEAMQGHNIVYEIPVIRNESSIPLADFFWRDVLPTNAVRVDRLVTGTFNHALRYRVMATTNLGNQIVVADNLSTLVNNVIELRPVHLGLAANEYVTEIIVFFGQVPAGFTSVERPRIFVDVLSDRQTILPDGMMFANKVDVGGRIPGTDEWAIGNSTVATTIFNPRRIPQSGW